MKIFQAMWAALFLVATLSSAHADTRATPADAQALVKRAIEFYKHSGRAVALAEFSKVNGKCLAHINDRVVGKNMWDQRDIDGKYFTRERLEAAKNQASGWQEFKFFNPATKRIEPKRQYWQRHDDLVFAVGAYRED